MPFESLVPKSIHTGSMKRPNNDSGCSDSNDSGTATKALEGSVNNSRIRVNILSSSSSASSSKKHARHPRGHRAGLGRPFRGVGTGFELFS